MTTRREFLKTGTVAAATAAGAMAIPRALRAQAKGPAGRITVALSTDLSTLDPSKDVSAIGVTVFKNLFDQLTDIRADGSVGPLLARSWESKDAVTWLFKLREGVKFHNGQAVTVDDVLWTFEAVMNDPKSPVRSYTATIDKIEKVDERTIRFVTKHPYAPFPRHVSLISILPREAYQAMGAEQFARKPIGCGPYRVVNWVRGDRLELEAAGAHFNGAANIKTVVFRPVPSESSRLSALESGDLDIVALLPPPEVPRLRKVAGVRVELVESNRNLFIGMNEKARPLDHPKVRQAIDLAIDREQITRELLGGLGKPVGQPVASAVFGFDPSLQPTKHDPQRARQLLREAGVADGLELDLQYPTNRYTFGTEVAQAVAGHLANAGVKVKLEGMEFAALFPLWMGKKLKGLYLFGFGPSIMDADLVLGFLYDSKGKGYWTSPEVDSLIQKQRGQADEQARLRTIHEIWNLSGQHVPISWLYTEVQSYGIRDRIIWKPRTDERFNMAEARLKS